MTKFDIAVIGGGAYATAVLGQLSLLERNSSETCKIVVIEKGQDFGPGLPYSCSTTISDHIVNIAGGCTQITASYIPEQENSDFLRWLRGLDKKYRHSLGLEDSEADQWVNQPFPRFIVGLYLQERYLPVSR